MNMHPSLATIAGARTVHYDSICSSNLTIFPIGYQNILNQVSYLSRAHFLPQYFHTPGSPKSNRFVGVPFFNTHISLSVHVNYIINQVSAKFNVNI